MKSPLHHIKNPEGLFEYFHRKVHHAFLVFGLSILGILRGTSNILTSTSASWQRGGFINQDFRDQNPSNENIKYAVFGDGTAGSTAYTKIWDSSCVPTNIVYLSAGSGGPLAGDTIYIMNAGTYTINNPIVINGDCSAIIGKGDVVLKAANGSIGKLITINNKNHIIIDNIKLDGQNLGIIGVDIDDVDNVTLNNMSLYSNTQGIRGINGSSYISLNNSRFFNNQHGGYFDKTVSTINNSLFFNNTYGILLNNAGSSINNAQFFNNTYGIHTTDSISTLNTVIFFNNSLGLHNQSSTGILNNVSLYNNTTGMSVAYSGYVDYYGALKSFANGYDYIVETGSTLQAGSTPPVSLRGVGQIESGSVSMNYDRVTNPQNGIGQWFLNGTNRSGLISTQTFDQTRLPIRYVFGGSIQKQTTPVRYNGTILETYGTDGYDYFATKYIAEPESSLVTIQQALVNQYFGSGSVYAQNRQTNGCSLSAFQVKTLNPTTFNTTYNFEDHTIYILTGGEYRSNVGGSSNGFVFNGNCIALVGTGNTRFTKSGGGGMNSILYANEKRNIIIDNIKVDGLYYDSNQTSTPAKSAIKLDGTSNNSTIYNVQIYNASAYGLYLGLNSHHNTITNTQTYNNGSAGIHLYYSSNYNVINNTQTYNNSGYGIWFANGSNRNAINNFQSYNNTVGIFGDLTTKENVINRSAIYNNSDAGIYFKNSSNNMLNDVMIYHNTIGVRMLYSSLGNKYYGELRFFDNISNNFDGTSGSDNSLSAGTVGLFPYAGILSTGTNIFSCLRATNPILSASSLTLLNSTCSNIGYVSAFQIPDTTYVNYLFGLDMYKQKIPVRYTTGNTLIQLTSQYDSNKYIAEIFAIWDTTPEGVNFLSSGSVEMNTWYSTNIYTAGVINVSVPVALSFTPTIAQGYLLINGSNVGVTGTINNGNTLQIYVLSSTGYNTTITGTISIGSVTTGFTITTRGMNQTPNTGSFAFANLTSIPLNTFTGSTTTIGGIETGVFASITFAPTTTSGWLEIYSGSTLIASGTSGLVVYSGYKVTSIVKSASGYAQTVTGYVTIGLGTGVFTVTTKGSDIVPPTTPTLTYPLSGEKMFFVTFERNASTDTGSGIEGYVYEIAYDTGFTHIVHTGFISTTTGTMGSPTSDFDPTSSKYYRRIKAQDRDGNFSARSSNIGYFRPIDSSDRNFKEKNNANLKTYYDSNEITISGLKTGSLIWATIDGDGTIYKNDNDAGTGTWVQNDDILYITMKSSSDYDDSVSSSLIIANRTVDFTITTTQESAGGCTISDADKTTIQTIFDSLIQNYSGDADKYAEFLYTIQSMLADEIDFTNDCNLQYLEDLINSELGIYATGDVTTGTHIAPNCKEYPITFYAAKKGYSSPIFKVATYFVNHDSLAKYIDSKNPGECHINTYGAASWIFTNTDTSRHVASNGKIYTIQYSTQGFTASEFVVKKYFSTIAELRNYIDSKNPAQAVRSHVVDTSFTPQAYTAPNNKIYTIYKTDRGYMSYKLIKIRYFSTLDELQSFISKNNTK